MSILDQLQANVEILLPPNGLEQKLNQARSQSRQLIIKLGFDPTAPDLHLGHAVVLKKLKQFQDLGHQIVIIVGSFTAQIGDPTGKSRSRKPLSKQEVLLNADTYIQQLAKVIDVEKCQIHFNSDWLAKLAFSTILKLLAKVTVAQLLHRNDFSKRFTENTPIGMHELIYPILQGLDSVEINADIEVGGTDQLFNCTMGRQLQEAHCLDPQVIMCMPLLKGLDGQEKMSKSLHNIIGLTDAPNDMFGKIMSLPDKLILDYLELATDFRTQEKQFVTTRLEAGENPMTLKKLIAKNIVQQYHDPVSAAGTEQFFINQFQNRTVAGRLFSPYDVTLLRLELDSIPLVELCHRLKPTETKSALRRLISNDAVRIDNQKITDPNQLIALRAGTKIKIGKRTFVELVVSSD